MSTSTMTSMHTTRRRARRHQDVRATNLVISKPTSQIRLKTSQIGSPSTDPPQCDLLMSQRLEYRRPGASPEQGVSPHPDPPDRVDGSKLWQLAAPLGAVEAYPLEERHKERIEVPAVGTVTHSRCR